MIESILEKNVTLDLTMEQILALNKSENNEFVNPTILGGSIQGASYRALDTDTGGRFNIFPEEDKNIGLIVEDAAGNDIFKIEIGGTNVGDVTLGDFAGGQGAQWDESAGTFAIKGTL